MVAQSVLLIVAGYLIGSIPAAYLVSRWFKRMDLRQYGSGTVSGSMVYEHVAQWAVIPVGLFDVFKAVLPAWLGLRLDLGLPVATAAGLAAAAGHNWSVCLRFIGGRGLSCFLGVWLVVFPWGFPWMLAFLAVGWLLGDSAPWALASLVAMPLLAQVADGSPVVAPAAGAMLLLTCAKRLEANRRPLPPSGSERRRVLLRRLIFDRDIASHADWIRRQPDQESDSQITPSCG